MPKKILRSKCSNKQLKQGKISAFVKPQTAKDLLKSKDGLKQGRIEAFMKKKSECVANTSSRTPSKRRRLSTEDVIPETPSPKVKRKSTPKRPSSNIIDLTDDEIETTKVKKSFKAKASLINLLEDDREIETKSPIEIKPIISEVDEQKHITIVTLDAKMEDNEELDFNLEHLSEENSFKPLSKEFEAQPETDDMCLNDSFLNAALEDFSPMKEKPTIHETCETNVLPFSVQCSSTGHSLAKYRHKILHVDEGYSSSGFHVKTLELENVATKTKLTCELHEGWSDTNVTEGDIVNVLASEEEFESGRIEINTKKNLLVVHPDILLSGTTVSNAVGCKRRAVLNERFKNTEIGDCGKPVMLIGTIVHTLFQTVVQHRQKFSQEQLLSLAEKEVSDPAILKDILALGTTQKSVLNGVKEFIPVIRKWVGEFVRDSPTIGVANLDIQLPPEYKNEDLAVDGNYRNCKFQSNVALTEVKDIEENVWSPLYGLKGKIDLTGGFLVKRRVVNNKSHCAKVILPLELKTGRESHSTEHHAQVAIYSMFCKQRRKTSGVDSTIPAGLLLYLKTGNVSTVPLKRDDERELTLIRNEVISYLARSILQKSKAEESTFEPVSFPPTIDDERFCTNCSQLRNCSLVYKSIDSKHKSLKPSNSMLELLNEQSSHLTLKDFDYFNHWMTCTMLETRKSMKDDTDQYYWLRSPEEREEAGSCITNMVLAGHGKQCEDVQRSLQTFKRSSACGAMDFDFSVFSEGDMVVVSGEEPAFVAMASGTVSNISKNFLTVVTDRKFDGYPKDMKYSIDKHRWSSMTSFNTSYRNLSVIMNSSPAANCLRELIIHHKEPTFGKQLHEVVLRSSKDEIARMLRGLNRTQRQAIKRVLLSKDYTLVVGMPGSGKTTTIVAMVRILLLCGCRVLLTSYTHSAIDNLLIKLIKYKVKFLRLGRSAQIHQSVQMFSEEEMTKNFSTPEELDKLYSEANVIGCTCLAITSHALFTSNGPEAARRSRFDVCIVDEASQISQPACLAPLLHADRFVLVGDHRQLPPLVRSRKARTIGADESLFWRLSTHDAALCDLTLQYRMNRAIMNVSNYVTYDGRLECATEATANAKLVLPNWKETEESIKQTYATISVHGREITETRWLLDSLNPEMPVVFLNTSQLKAYEEEVENGIQNQFEAEILKIIVENLIQAGCSPEDVGIISPFRKQLKAIESCMLAIKAPNIEKIEINTVDKYQGRDKSVILMSFVRSKNCESGDKVGELLSDWRRLNVALTRAKHKMILVGCQKTLNSYEPCRKLLNHLEAEDMIIAL